MNYRYVACFALPRTVSGDRVSSPEERLPHIPTPNFPFQKSMGEGRAGGRGNCGRGVLLPTKAELITMRGEGDGGCGVCGS